jgi:hypothetical protein
MIEVVIAEETNLVCRTWVLWVEAALAMAAICGLYISHEHVATVTSLMIAMMNPVFILRCGLHLHRRNLVKKIGAARYERGEYASTCRLTSTCSELDHHKVHARRPTKRSRFSTLALPRRSPVAAVCCLATE